MMGLWRGQLWETCVLSLCASFVCPGQTLLTDGSTLLLELRGGLWGSEFFYTGCSGNSLLSVCGGPLSQIMLTTLIAFWCADIMPQPTSFNPSTPQQSLLCFPQFEPRSDRKNNGHLPHCYASSAPFHSSAKRCSLWKWPALTYWSLLQEQV